MKSRNDHTDAKVCFTSKRDTGSWQIRGVQISALSDNWSADLNPLNKSFSDFDILCVVKNPDFKVISRARRHGMKIVFDIVDSWKQPKEGMKCKSLSDARTMFAKKWSKIDADTYIFPNKQMLLDLGDVVPHGVVIYHHFKPQIPRNPLRHEVKTIGYEGADFLGEWKSEIELSCKERGLNFVVNPVDYSDLDIVVLVRGGNHANFLSHRYKSNVKLANAYGSGTPALVHYKEQSAHETNNGNVLFFTDLQSFNYQLDRLCKNLRLRQQISESFISASYDFNIETIASQYDDLFKRLSKKN